MTAYLNISKVGYHHPSMVMGEATIKLIEVASSIVFRNHTLYLTKINVLYNFFIVLLATISIDFVGN